MPNVVTGNKKIINAWAMYDWANSVYSLVITSTIFPIYYNAVTKHGNSDEVIFFGFRFINTALLAYSLSFSFLLISFLSPVLSGMADYSGKKKTFMKFFCYLGSASCLSMYFFDSSALYVGIFAYVFASVGYTGSIVFYNAYLPEIAEPKDCDRVSAKGFAMGYIGSSLLLIFNLVMITYPNLFGLKDETLASKISFLTVGVWWAGFAQIPFHFLPENIYHRRPQGNLLTKGFKELKNVFLQLKHQKKLQLFLSSFFFYSMGVQTVMYLAVSFADKELQLKKEQLIISVLIIQFVAVGGAYLFSHLSKLRGNIFSIGIAVIVWIGICTGAYFVRGQYGFYTLAFFVGMVMGGIQSLSRSTYAKMLPETEDHASYFSFYDVTEKIAIVLGTFSFGLIEEITGSMRNSALALMIFFVLGLLILTRVRMKKE